MLNFINKILYNQTIKIKIEFYNPIVRYLCYRRGLKLTKYWNDNLNIIQEHLNLSKDKEKDYINWDIIVRQELRMYNIIGKKVSEDDLISFCKENRKLSDLQLNFIREGLKYIGLYFR